MPDVERQRTVHADPAEVWDVLADPHHLPRWWPRVERVEGAGADGWTSVMRTDKGRTVRADFRVVASEPPHRREWAQELAGTPFERVLAESTSEARLAPDPDGVQVTLAVHQRLRGVSRFGGWMITRAARRQLDEALAGLAAACER